MTRCPCGGVAVCTVDSRPYTATTWPACERHATEAFSEGHDCDGWEPAIFDEPYDRDGTPGRACPVCCSAWPATEKDDEPWHHANGCRLAAAKA